MFLKIVFKQLRHKWEINLLLFLTMTALVSLHVFIGNTNRFTIRSMQLIMKNMGLNQMMIPAAQSALDTHLCTENQLEFPQTITRAVAGHPELLSRYYVSVLQRRVDIDGHDLLLTGIEPVARADETQEKGGIVKPLNPGMARVGSAAAVALNVRKEGRIEVENREFTVEQIAPKQGTLDDYRVYLNLTDMQQLVGKPGMINAVLSFECLHIGGTLDEIHDYQRVNLARILPEFKQINIEPIARGRYYARRMTNRYQYCLVALVAAITVLVVVITGFQEVHERRYETGILIAQGAAYRYIMGLYLSKTIILAAAAALIGFVAGGIASVMLTTPFLATNTREVTILWGNLPPTLMLITAVALIAELIPMIRLVRMDPCAIVMEE